MEIVAYATNIRELIARATTFKVLAMRTPLPPAQLAAWCGLITAQANVVSRIEEALAAAQLPVLAWYDVLFALHEQPEQRLRMAELAEKVLLSRSGLTRLVDRLEAESLLLRETCATDKRGFHVCLTEAGTEMLRKIWPVYREGIARWFAQHLSDAEVAVLTRTFDKINAAAGPSSRPM
jgi:DNA-binding MarR family transcriptional regulator